MKILLNPDLKLNSQSHTPDVKNFINSVLYSVNNKEDTLVYVDSEISGDTERLHRGFLGLLAHAYSNHEKIQIAPHDIWFIFTSELSRIVNNHPEEFRHIFTNSQKKVGIQIPTDDIRKINPLDLVATLKTLIPTNVEVFFPHISTATPDVELALSANFCDMVQQYYSYSTFLCGIPEIEVTGTVEDWFNLLDSTYAIEKLFGDILPDTIPYLKRFGQIINFILVDKKFNEPTVEFWQDIFTSKNVGSGGQLAISGWITDLFYEKREVKKLENYDSSWGVIPYKNLDSGRSFKAVHGAFSQLRNDEGFIYSGYGQLIFEVIT